MIELNGQKNTRRRFLDVYIYGGLAHANAEKKAIYDTWMRIPLLKELLNFNFVNILMDAIRIINYVYGINEDVLKYLERTEP